MAELKRIPRKAKKGKRYVKWHIPMPDWSSMGKIYTITMAAMATMYHNAHFKRNTRGSRQYVNIMVRHGLMKRPERPKPEMVLTKEQQQAYRERIFNEIEDFLNDRQSCQINGKDILTECSKQSTRPMTKEER